MTSGVLPFRLPASMDAGQSPQAESVRRILKENMLEMAKRFAATETLSSPASRLTPLIEDVREEANEVGWDGHGGAPVTEENLAAAIRFASILPPGWPLPEVAADPDGEIEFEWQAGPGRVFSVIVGKEGRLTYAGLFGRNRLHGVEYLEARFPSAIRAYLDRLYSEEAETSPTRGFSHSLDS